MSITDTELEKVLMGLLQKDIKLLIDGKLFRKGKLLLFRQNNYCLELTIRKNNIDIKKFEVPIPFAIENWDDDGVIYFDYRIATLAHKDKVVLDMIKKLPTNGQSKFYDKILEIEIGD